jgi:outer membrane protein
MSQLTKKIGWSLPWCGLVCVVLQTPALSVHAQQPANMPSTAKPSAANVNADREKTRQMIQGVTADQPGELDQALTLGTRLTTRRQKPPTPSLADMPPAVVTEADATPARRPSVPALPPIVLNQWPTMLNPDKSVGRISNKRRGLANQDESLVYTPDFSRQLLTFGIMAKSPYIDLPDKEINDAAGNTLTFNKNAVDTSQAKTLAEMVKLGLGNSPVLDQALAQIDIAVSRSQQARSELLPKASARYQTGREKSEPLNQPVSNHATESTSLRLVQPIINLPAVRDWMAELSNEQATVWRSYAANESVALAVTNAVLALASARMVLEFSDEQLEEFNNLFTYVQNRAQSGAASPADLERLRARVLQARQNRIEQQANYKSALLELERLTGDKPTSMQLPYLNQLPGLPATQAQIRQMVWESSQDLRILRKDVKTQEQVVSSIYARLLPTLSLNLERDEAQNMRGVNPKQIDSRILGVVNWELSLGGKEFYAARLAKAELANRQSRLTEEADRIMQGVDADFALLQSATLRIATAQAEQDAALLVLQSVQQQMKTGRVGSMLEALDANERYFSSRQRLVQTLTQQMQAHAQLLRRLGMLSQVQSMVNQPTDINSSMSMVKKAVSVEPTRPSDKDARPQATPAMTDLPTQAVNQGPATEIMLPPAQPLDVKELNNMLEPNPNTGNSSP